MRTRSTTLFPSSAVSIRALHITIGKPLNLTSVPPIRQDTTSAPRVCSSTDAAPNVQTVLPEKFTRAPRSWRRPERSTQQRMRRSRSRSRAPCAANGTPRAQPISRNSGALSALPHPGPPGSHPCLEQPPGPLLAPPWLQPVPWGRDFPIISCQPYREPRCPSLDSSNPTFYGRWIRRESIPAS